MIITDDVEVYGPGGFIQVREHPKAVPHSSGL